MKVVANIKPLAGLSKGFEGLHKSAFPVAVRGVLNSLAFDMKQNTLLKSAKLSFVERQPNFFKATSRVEKANGFDVNSMKATVGFIGKNQAIDDLEKQERGGSIGGRSFVPMDTARTSGSPKKKIKPAARLTNIQKIIVARNSKGKNRREKFTKAAIHAGMGGFVLSETLKGESVLFRINSLKRVGKDTKINSTPLYSYDKGRIVNVDATGFVLKAQTKTMVNVVPLFVKEAQKQFAKVRKK
jgi:hypothetical protein